MKNKMPPQKPDQATPKPASSGGGTPSKKHVKDAKMPHKATNVQQNSNGAGPNYNM